MDFLHVWKKSWITFFVSWGMGISSKCARVCINFWWWRSTSARSSFRQTYTQKPRTSTTTTRKSMTSASWLEISIKTFWAGLFIPSLQEVAVTAAAASTFIEKKTVSVLFFCQTVGLFFFCVHCTKIQSASFFIFQTHILPWNTALVDQLYSTYN